MRAGGPRIEVDYRAQFTGGGEAPSASSAVASNLSRLFAASGAETDDQGAPSMVTATTGKGAALSDEVWAAMERARQAARAKRAKQREGSRGRRGRRGSRSSKSNSRSSVPSSSSYARSGSRSRSGSKSRSKRVSATGVGRSRGVRPPSWVTARHYEDDGDEGVNGDLAERRGGGLEDRYGESGGASTRRAEAGVDPFADDGPNPFGAAALRRPLPALPSSSSGSRFGDCGSGAAAWSARGGGGTVRRGPIDSRVRGSRGGGGTGSGARTVRPPPSSLGAPLIRAMVPQTHPHLGPSSRLAPSSARSSKTASARGGAGGRAGGIYAGYRMPAEGLDGGFGDDLGVGASAMLYEGIGTMSWT